MDNLLGFSRLLTQIFPVIPLVIGFAASPYVGRHVCWIVAALALALDTATLHYCKVVTGNPLYPCLSVASVQVAALSKTEMQLLGELILFAIPSGVAIAFLGAWIGLKSMQAVMRRR